MSLMAMVRPERVAQMIRCLNQLEPRNRIAIVLNLSKIAIGENTTDVKGEIGEGGLISPRSKSLFVKQFLAWKKHQASALNFPI
jgi:hypothetical protein